MSLFGQSGGNPSLFANNNNQQKPASPFGAAQPASSNAGPQGQSGGLFGSAPTSQPLQSGSLFGATAAAPQAQQSGSPFGAASQPQTQTGTSLFGGPLGQSQPQNQAQGGGLFGSTQQPQPQQPTGSSLFGSSLALNQNQPQNQSVQSTGGLFGGAAATQNKPPLSLFGVTANPSNQPQQTQTQQQPQQPSLFSNSTNNLTSPIGNNNRLPGTLTMGQSTSQPQQQTVPGVRIDVSNLRGTTRYNDLHEELQKQIEQIDLFIQQQISFKEQCDALMPAHEQNLSTIPSDVDFVKAKQETAELTLSNDSDAINAMKTVTQRDTDDARVGFRAVENLKLPQQFHYSGIWRPSASTITPPRGAGSADQAPGASSSAESTDLVGYFNNQTVDLAKLLDMYTNSVNEIETHIGTVEASAMAQSHQLMFRRGRDGTARTKDEQVAELSAVLRQFESGILGVAGKVGQAREDVVDVIEKDTHGGALNYRR